MISNLKKRGPAPKKPEYDSEGHRLYALHGDLVLMRRGYAYYQLGWERLTPVQKARWRVLAHEMLINRSMAEFAE